MLSLAASGAGAVDGPYIQPSSAIMGFSPDNTVAVSNYYGSLFIFDLESGEEPRIFTESADGLTSYATGVGNFVGNNTVCASRGSNYSASAYIFGATGAVNGRFVTISNDAVKGIGGPNGVTPDGSRLCGNAPTGVEFGIDADNTMTVPCIWNRSGNTFSRIMLPCPAGDYLGRAPQYVTADCISADGRTIVGQCRSGNGFLTEFLVYREGADGTWSVSKPFESLVNPNHIELPPYPGEGPQIVSEEQFMTDEEIAAYQAALQAYYADPENGRMPTYAEFMTQQEIDAYNKAIEPYNEWVEKYEKYEAADIRIRQESVSFVFNQAAISPNGKYFVGSGETGYYDENLVYHAEYTPYLYDLEEQRILVSDGPAILVTAVSDDGTVVGYERRGDVDFGYVLPLGASEWIPLEKWVVARNPELADWVEQNWKHEIEVVIDEEENITEYQEMYITGLPFMSPDFSMLSTVAYYFWSDAPDALRNDVNSCIVPLGAQGAINEVTAAGAGCPVEYFNLQGVRVAEPAHGVYIMRRGNDITKILR